MITTLINNQISIVKDYYSFFKKYDFFIFKIFIFFIKKEL